MNKRILALAIILFLGFFIIIPKKEGGETNEFITLVINNTEIRTEVVDTVKNRSLGLSGRANLGENGGMLFVFEKPQNYEFWMKDMNFPIDIIWIGEDEIIKKISHQITPETYPETFSAGEPIKFVLEVNAGFSEKNEIATGDSVVIK